MPLRVLLIRLLGLPVLLARGPLLMLNPPPLLTVVFPAAFRSYREAAAAGAGEGRAGG